MSSKLGGRANKRKPAWNADAPESLAGKRRIKLGRLEGKVAIVTGGAQGMGYAHVARFIAEGAKVALTDISEKGQKAADEIGGGALFIKHDVTKETSWKEVVDTVQEKFGNINVLVNNAGIGY
jgi:3alpha(or 20beta)-hydroxysteroid dehydrogenase